MKLNKYALPQYEKDLELGHHLIYYGLVMIFGVGIVFIGGLFLTQ